jgi:hypothetical protein
MKTAGDIVRENRSELGESPFQPPPKKHVPLFRFGILTFRDRLSV